MNFPLRIVSVCVALASGILLFDAKAILQQRDNTIAQKIAELSSRLEKASTTPQERDSVSAAIRNEVKEFVESSLSPSESSDGLQQRLRAVLQTQVPDFEYSDPPTIRVRNLRNGRSVVVAYSVVRPPHFDAPTITAFTESGGHFAQSASIESDFEGYTLFTKDLQSPSKDVLWLLAGGKAFTFNGSKFRFRLYTFDGNAFETAWAPEDMLDANLQVLPEGFSVSHYNREQRATVTEQYRTTVSGLIRVR
jgi:hypothetical protein